jgi:hypothetical protein
MKKRFKKRSWRSRGEMDINWQVCFQRGECGDCATPAGNFLHGAFLQYREHCAVFCRSVPGRAIGPAMRPVSSGITIDDNVRVIFPSPSRIPTTTAADQVAGSASAEPWTASQRMQPRHGLFAPFLAPSRIAVLGGWNASARATCCAQRAAMKS